MQPRFEDVVKEINKCMSLTIFQNIVVVDRSHSNISSPSTPSLHSSRCVGIIFYIIINILLVFVNRGKKRAIVVDSDSGAEDVFVPRLELMLLFNPHPYSRNLHSPTTDSPKKLKTTTVFTGTTPRPPGNNRSSPFY